MGTISIGTLMASIGGDISPLKGALGEANNALNKFTDQASKNAEALKNQFRGLTSIGDSMKSVGKKMSVGLTLPLGLAGVAAFKMASDLEENLNKTRVAFRGSGEEVIKWSKDTLKSFGIAQSSALDMASLFGDMSTSMGLTGPEAAKMSTSLVGLAGDLASFKNIRTDTASTALKGIFTGETESLKGLGIVMTEENLKQFAMSQGIKENIKDMTQAEKVQLRYAFVMANTTNAQGDFIRTGGGAANQMRIFGESLKQIGASFGTIILPSITAMITKVNSLMAWVEGLTTTQKKWVIGIGAVVAAIGPLTVGLGFIISNVIPKLVTGIKGIGTALKFLGANPIILIIAAVAALAIGIMALWKHCETFRAIVKTVAENVAAFFQKAWLVIRTGAEVVWNVIEPIFKGIWTVIKWVGEGIGTYFKFIWGVISDGALFIWSVVKWVADAIGTAFKFVWEGIKGGAKLMLDAVIIYFTAIPKLATAVWNIVKRVMKGGNIGEAIKDEFGNAFAEIKESVKETKDEFNAKMAEIKTPDFKSILDKEKAVSAAKETGEAVKTQLEESFTATSTGTGGTGVGKKAAPRENITPMTGKSVSSVSGGLGLDFSLAETNIDAYKTLSDSLSNVDKAFLTAKNSAELFGQPFDANTVKLEALKTEIDKLTNEGFPQNKAAIETLAAQYRDLQTEMNSTKLVSIDVGSTMSSSLNSAFSSIGSSLGDLFSGTANVGDLFSNLMDVVASFLSSLGESLIAAGVGAIAFKKLLATPGLAIAAGVALVALSAVVSNLLSSGTDSSSTDTSTVNTGSVASLATGGLAYGPTYAQIGDNPQARFDPEFIAPVSQVGKYLNQGDNNSNIPSYITLSVKGEDLEAIINTRQKRNNNLR
jgi:phage-related protein